MDARTFANALEQGLCSYTINAQIGRQQQNVRQEVEDQGSPSACREYLDSLRADNVTLTFFVEEPGAEATVKECAKFLGEKLGFNGNLITPSKKTSQGKAYYFMPRERRDNPFADASFWEED